MKKPILRLRPRSIADNAFNSERIKEIRVSIARYNSAGLEVPKGWHQELSKRINKHRKYLTTLGLPLNIRNNPNLDWIDLTANEENCVVFSQILEGSCSYANSTGFYLVGDIRQFSHQNALIFTGHRRFYPEEIRNFLPPIALMHLVSFKRFRYAEVHIGE